MENANLQVPLFVPCTILLWSSTHCHTPLDQGATLRGANLRGANLWAMQSDAALQAQHAAFQTLSVSLFGAVTAKVE